MSVEQLRKFLDLHAFDNDVRWWIKRLSANDTHQTQSHQAGLYIPKRAAFGVLPELPDLPEDNPRVPIDAEIVSHHYTATVNAIWYNNKYRGGTRDEVRITGWGGLASPMLDSESTGAATAFAVGGESGARWCKVWICENEDEADFLEERFGEIEPGRGVLFPPVAAELAATGCGLEDDEIPLAWANHFPSPHDILEKSLSMRPQFTRMPVDKRLVRRRQCEYELFLSIESATWLPRVRGGFESVEDFVGVAQTILQRRRSRSGKSLERHLRLIFAESNLIEGQDFDEQVETELGKTPDFIFPSETAYRDECYDESALRMLAVKNTVRDRWRQVLDEADRIDSKHLLTLQEGVSEKQYTQMKDAGLKLVVPAPLQKHYPEPVRGELLTLQAFIQEVADLQTDRPSAG